MFFLLKKTWLFTSPCVPVYRSSLSQSRYARACTGGLLCLQRKKLQAFSPSNQSSFLTTINLACGTPHAAGRAPEELINPWRKKGCDRQKTERGEYSCIIIPLPLLLLFSFALAGEVLLGWTHLLLHRSPSPTDQLSPPRSPSNSYAPAAREVAVSLLPWCGTHITPGAAATSVPGLRCG